ncbi:hypothetical protein ACWEN4_03855 [Streptomyces violaceorubidus]
MKKNGPLTWAGIALIAYLLFASTDAGRDFPGGHWTQCNGPSVVSTHSDQEKAEFCASK